MQWKHRPMCLMLVLTTNVVFASESKHEINIIDAQGNEVTTSSGQISNQLLQNFQANANKIQTTDIENYKKINRWRLDQVWIGLSLKLSFNLATILSAQVSPGTFLILKPRSKQ